MLLGRNRGVVDQVYTSQGKSAWLGLCWTFGHAPRDRHDIHLLKDKILNVTIAFSRVAYKGTGIAQVTKSFGRSGLPLTLTGSHIEFASLIVGDIDGAHLSSRNREPCTIGWWTEVCHVHLVVRADYTSVRTRRRLHSNWNKVDAVIMPHESDSMRQYPDVYRCTHRSQAPSAHRDRAPAPEPVRAARASARRKS